ncbi:Asp-tRNA(Asn)/Glu-tRNA(Gln) amidotransferase subunit GatB [sulfur-oxidizing endosymbiont of Gigantopelta aegis]|uniref:Asp-tRNA(Asn)/Glu-tRNA(Gln) amidotransferase subunit GatB n=1 Tax=sulfur-oxidizing endosymbiont of Gigantopelta aegis TaxID=2794934 RepID=UPI0018DC5C23|nr:Asp-tRNA(Asn)/Glu-tRNA(Gln) amidotransferase subunit GatB [sulfur-oxidizing endosymbiont of Gigantopelta aegis]
MQWEVVIGLEIHVQLATQSKIFSGASTAYGAEPNTQACTVDLGLPGVLPVFNGEALNKSVMFGLAIGAKINERSVFDRKNYFYPDSPKAYQISQLYYPIVGEGEIDIDMEDGSQKRIGVTRAHMEEDAGKSLHENFQNQTGIDLNRAGTPLLEIVSDPDMRSAKEAVAYMRKIHSIVRYLGISDGNMQEGSFRCDANVSLRPKGQEEFGTRAELKNINSFRFVEKAINVEIERQMDILESGGKVTQETRLYDADKNETRSMRSKEEANDYRYFPDPDLLPIVISKEDIEAIRKTLPELPDAKCARYMEQLGLSEKDAKALTVDRDMAEYYEQVQQTIDDAKMVANWIVGDVAALNNKVGVEFKQCPVSTEQLTGLLSRIKDNTISGKIAKDVFLVLAEKGGTADSIIEEKGLKQITDTGAIEAIIDEVIANNPGQVAEFQSGKDKLIGFFVGQVMKASKGKANPGQVNQLLQAKLKH